VVNARRLHERNCWHEAGHAVAAIMSGCQLEAVSVLTAPPECTALCPVDDPAAAVVFALGGPVAVLRVMHTLEGSREDIAVARALCVEHGLVFDEMLHRTQQIITEAWPLVCDLGELLNRHGEITGAQLEQLAA
jgi:hypothetical protein